jgi:Ca-activated chloride channel family protein
MAGRHQRPSTARAGSVTHRRVPAPPRRRRRGVRLAIAPWIVLSTIVVVLLSGMTVGYALLATAGCSGAPLKITVLSSPDQAKVLSGLAERWTRDDPEVDGKCVAAAVEAKEPAEVAEALSPFWSRGDGPRPDVWAPDSNAWAKVAAVRPDAAQMLPDKAPSLGTSPVIIAMPRPMAEAIGWPKKSGLGWQTMVTNLAGQNWGKYKHPEWGPFSIGMTDPTRSTAGLHTLLTITDASGDGKVSKEELTAGLALERSTKRYEPDTASLFDGLAKADKQSAQAVLKYVSAFPATERDVSTYNASEPQVPLAGVYPSEGGVDADHPYLVLDAPWVDSAKERVANDFRDFVRSETGRTAYSEAGFRGADRSPPPEVTAERGLQPTVGTKIRTVGQPEQISLATSSWNALRRRANVLTVMDVSGSMDEPVPGAGGTRLQLSQKAAVQALGMFAGDSKLGLWEFSTNRTPTTDYREVVPLGPVDGQLEGSTRRKVGAAAINGLQAEGGTALYDTTLAAYKAAKKDWENGRLNVVVLLTDGKNEDSDGLDRAALLDALQDEVRKDQSHQVQIITIAYSEDADVEALRQISQTTGGQTFVSQNPKDITQIFIAALFGR